MSYHILHLLSPNLRVRLKLEQLHITDRESGVEKTVPLADVAVIIAAAPDTTVTTAALRRMTELGVMFLVCNERFEPACLTLPYYRATDTDLLRRQVEWTPAWKEAMWKQVVAAKIRNQATMLASHQRAHAVLQEIATRCERGADRAEAERPRVDVSKITPRRRAFFLSDDATACESRAARHYWKHLLPLLSDEERTREPGTRTGVNGMLDYGYAVLRSAVLRSLAAHGFIAALGIHHAAKAGSFALADDLMEPLRPWCDRALKTFLGTKAAEAPEHEQRMKAWIPLAAGLLTGTVRMGRQKVRLLHAVDLYVRSFADATLSRVHALLRIPLLEDS